MWPVNGYLGLRSRDLGDTSGRFERTWSKARKVEELKSDTSRRTVSVSAWGAYAGAEELSLGADRNIQDGVL